MKIVSAGGAYRRDPQRSDLYAYSVHVGKHSVEVEEGDSGWTLEKDRVTVTSGCALLQGDLTVVIRGYTPPRRTAELQPQTHLPYINGCSATNLIPPLRPGDPCVQLLHIPAGCSEQRHHIHSTPRVVRVLHGRGVMEIGIGERVDRHELAEGTTVIIDALEPHHFVAPETDLFVVPIHVWSSTSAETAHPMMLGTHLV